MPSPTQRTLKLLRNEGWTAQVVEHWNPFAKVRIDLFGCIDIVAISNGRLVGVQATSATHHATRKNKILGLSGASEWIRAAELWVVSWGKKGNRWVPRVEVLDPKEFSLTPFPSKAKMADTDDD